MTPPIRPLLLGVLAVAALRVAAAQTPLPSVDAGAASRARSEGEASPSPERAKAEAHDALKAKGLRRDGRVYVLRAEDDVNRVVGDLELTAREADEAIAQMSRREAAAAQARLAINEMVRQHEDLVLANEMASVVALGGTTAKSSGDTASQNPSQQRAALAESVATRNRQIAALETDVARLQTNLIQLMAEYNRLGSYVLTRQAVFRRGEAELSRLVEDVRRTYQALGENSGVSAALGALNKDSEARYALGPRENYRANLQKLAAGLLSSKGYEVRRGGPVVLGADADVKTAIFLVESFQSELAAALARRLSLTREVEFRARRLAELTAASSPSSELTRLRQEQADAAKVLKEWTQEVVAKREGFVESVRALRLAVEASRKKHDEVAGDRDVRQALVDLKAKRARGGAAAKKTAGQVPAVLLEAEKAIRAERIPLTPDRAAPWVLAALNDGPPSKLVVDPTADALRVSDRFASAHRIEPGEGPAVAVAMSDGTTVQGRPAKLRSVRVGGFVVRDVPCVVLLDGYDGPPVLGSAFLDHFVSKLDANGSALTLTEVSIKPRAARAPSRGGAPSKK